MDQLIKDGANCLLTNGTAGECSTLLWEEHKAFAEVVIAAARKRVPVFIGTTSLSTRETIHRLKLFMDMGADGTLLGPPFWQKPTLEVAIAHYKMVSQAVPNAAIFVYANVSAFKFDFPPVFWGAMHREVPQAIGAKYSNPSQLLASLEASDYSIRLCPNWGGIYAAARLAPEHSTACWIHSFQPGPVLAMLDALKKMDWERAWAIHKEFEQSGEPQRKALSGSGYDFNQFNIQLVKIKDDATGYCRVGGMRPPYHLIPDKLAEGARLSGIRWQELAAKYAAVAVTG